MLATIYTKHFYNILAIIITAGLAATRESENKYDTFIYVYAFRNAPDSHVQEITIKNWFKR